MAFITTTAASISSGGTISGDLTIEGDLTVNGDGAGAYDEIINGNLRLDTPGSSATTLEFVPTGGQASQIKFFQDDGSTQDARIFAPEGTTKLAFEAGTTEMMRMTTTGVGIGTDSPSHKLSVNGATTIYGQNAAHDVSALVLSQESSTKSQIRAYGSDGTTSGSLEVIVSASDGSPTNTVMLLDANSRISLSNNGGDTTNTIFGYQAGNSIDGGSAMNTFIGHQVADATMTGDADENTAVGHLALSGLTEGAKNIAIGSYAGINITGGDENVLIGRSAGNAFNSNKLVSIGTATLASINHANADGSVAIGQEAMTSLTSGTRNTAIGYQSSYYQSTGTDNTYLGHWAGSGESGGNHSNNVGIGSNALGTINTGGSNVGIGHDALKTLDDGTENVAIGTTVMEDATSGSGNVSIGTESLMNLTTGSNNVAIGKASLNGTGVNPSNSVAVGYAASRYAEGNNNVSLGQSALRGDNAGNFVGHSNIAIGYEAMDALEVGEEYNIAIGSGAIGAMQEGSAGGDVDHNIAIGLDAFKGGDLATADNQVQGNIAIGSYALDATGANAQTGTVAIGHSALSGLTSGIRNTAVGYLALSACNNNHYNTAVGWAALYNYDLEEGNTAIGHEAMGGSGASNNCVAIGSQALDGATTTGANGTVAIGVSSLGALTSGAANTAIGYQSMLTHTTGGKNIAIGHQVMFDTDAGSNSLGSSENVFIGYQVASGTWTNAACNHNVGIGNDVMRGALDGATQNVAVGSEALMSLTTGDGNVALGYKALEDVNTGGSNVAIGNSSGISLTSGTDNVAIGTTCLYNSTDVDKAIFIGKEAGNGALDSDADGIIGIGYQALTANTSGRRNIAIGYQALDAAVTGDDNTAVGYQALSAQDADKTGATAIGSKALYQNAPAGTSDYSVAVGYEAGSNQTTGYQNTFLGGASSGSGADGINQIVIGYHAASLGDNTAVIGNEDITDVYLADDVGATLHSFKGSIGDNKTPTSMLEVWKDNINSDHYTSSDDFIGIRGYFKYTGASSKDFGNDDDLYGALLQTEFDDGQSSGAFRNMYGMSVDANAVDCADSGNTLGAYIRGKLGGADADIEKLFGAHIVANLSHDGTVDNDVRGALVEIDADDGTVGGNMAGLEVNVDLEANCEVAGDVVGVLIGVDDDDASAGSAYGMRINCASNVTAAIDLVGGGIRFPSSQSASSNSNTLDDYEEGEYQPTVNASTSGSFTPGNSRTYLTYTKIGRQVTVSGQIDISNESSPSGNLQVSLPFTVGATTEAGDTAFGVGQISSHGGTIANNCSSVAFQGEALMKFFNVSDSGTFAYITESDIDHSFSIHISITFIAA